MNVSIYTSNVKPMVGQGVWLTIIPEGVTPAFELDETRLLGVYDIMGYEVMETEGMGYQLFNTKNLPEPLTGKKSEGIYQETRWNGRLGKDCRITLHPYGVPEPPACTLKKAP